MNSLSHCPVCNSTNFKNVYSLQNVPVVCNQLWQDAEAARMAPAGDVDLLSCTRCAMIWNASFDAERMVYASGYENALHFSPTFKLFAHELVAGFVERHDLKGKSIIEIGCGDGYMLDLFCQHGVANATGFDPSMKGISSPFTGRDGVGIIPEYFNKEQLNRPFDAIVCRHMLEHLDEPLGLFSDIRQAIGSRDVPVYFEVPNAKYMLEALFLWDIIYEHVGYWSAPSFKTILHRAGFKPVSISTGYDQQFLMVEARPSQITEDYLALDTECLLGAAESFGLAARAEIVRWQNRLSSFKGNAVVWGAGSKGITFANSLGEAGASLIALVDLNSRKHGLYAPGVALPIIAPEELLAAQPELVLISNGLYEQEIVSQVHDLGLDPVFSVIAG